MRAALSASRATAAAFGRTLPASGWAVVLLAAGLAGWLAVLMLMGGMDEGPGTPLDAFPIFLVGWVVMLTAMMLPSELSYINAFAALLKSRHGAAVAPAATVLGFVAGYGIAWVCYGLVAYALDAAVRTAGLEILSWSRAGPLLAGSVLILAGAYQVSPLKHLCLTHCRTPLAFFARNWRDGRRSAVLMGLRHGIVCVGCCWALMAVMFAVGVMNLTWMALLTVIMFAEKVFPQGQKLAVPIACLLWTMGIWVAVSPETAPLLKAPLVFGGSICRSL